MDEWNIRNMKRICDNDPEHKIHLLLEYSGTREEVEDPWWDENFERAWDQIYNGCINFLDYLKEKKNEDS